MRLRVLGTFLLVAMLAVAGSPPNAWAADETKCPRLVWNWEKGDYVEV